jgi:FkbM family methyltransferase
MSQYAQVVKELTEQDAFPADAFYGYKAFADRKIIIYGAGEGFHWVQEILMRHYGFMPSVVLDRRFTCGESYEGIQAFSPHQYRPSIEEQRDAVVIVCVGKQEYHPAILSMLDRMGFRNVVLMMDVYEIHNPLNLPEELARDGFQFYRERKDRIVAGLDLFADDLSRETYSRCLQTHLRRKPVPLPARPGDEQYVPRDIHLSRGYDKVINCGAYDGDTVRRLHATRGRIEEIICLETEPELYVRLTAYLQHHRNELADRVVALPCAAYSRDGILPYVSGGGLGSRVSASGDAFVQCVALDHVLPGCQPTFICMDIEGAEPEALKGAEGIIRSSRPDLAICVYHAPNHLWEIAQYLNGLELGYRFYLRNYTTFSAETVLYATT